MKPAFLFLFIAIAATTPFSAAGDEVSRPQADTFQAAVPHAQRVTAWPRRHRASALPLVRPPVESSDGKSSPVPAELEPNVEGAARALASAKLSGGGAVSLFELSPDGLSAVWIEIVAGIAELFSRPVDGSLPAVQLTSGLFGIGDFGVSEFDFSPDGSTLVFTGDFVVGSGTNSLARVAVGGGAITTLNAPLVDEPVTGFLISPNGSVVLYLGLDGIHGSGRIEVHTNSIVGGIPVQLSTAGLSAHGQADVVTADFTMDSANVIYAADIVANSRIDLFASPVNGASTTALSSALGTVTWLGISPTRVVYISDDDTFAVQEVYSVLVDGTGKLKLNSVMVGNAIDLDVSPDGSLAAYRADQEVLGIVEGYTASVGVAASSVKFHDALTESRDVDSLNFTPDVTGILYRADELQPGDIELFSRPLDLSEPSTLLHDAAIGQTVGFFPGRGVPVLNRRAVYPFFSDTIDLYSVAIDGTEPFVRLNAPPVLGVSLRSGYVPFFQAAKLVAYGVGPGSGGITDKIFSTPIRNDLPEEQFNVTAGVGDLGVDNYLINSIETHGVYTQDQDTQGVLELYSAGLDSDGDGDVNATDTCKFVPNPGGAPAPFSQTLNAVDKTTFGWTVGAELTFAQGLLPLDNSYSTTTTGFLDDANSYEIAATPSPGGGIWTLVAPACAARDWGNSGRNSALP